MNSSVYIFGELTEGYTQYPDDGFSAEIFKKCLTGAKCTTQLVAHRDGQLMYYTYLRNLQDNKSFGMCVVVNGMYLTCINKIFSLFEEAISYLATTGRFICYNEKGDLQPTGDKLYEQKDALNFLNSSLSDRFNSLQEYSHTLPSEDYAVSITSQKEFSLESGDRAEMLKSTYLGGFTYIFKADGYNTAQMNSYKGVLSRITADNERLKEENNKLKSDNAQIKRQKNRYQWVLVLCGIVLVCVIGLFNMNDSLNSTQSQLGQANDAIQTKNAVISNKDNYINELTARISSLQASLSSEQQQREAVENDLQQLSSNIPIIITDVEIANVDYSGNIETNYGNTIYTSNTMYLKPRITYTGIAKDENIELQARLYGIGGALMGGSFPYGYTFTSSMTVNGGSGNTFEMSGWGNSTRGYWGAGYYRYEIWYGDKCLGSKAFRIY